VRAAAVRGLGRLGAEAAAPLLAAVRDPARVVREEAVAGLGAAWAERPVGELEARLRDETDADLRYAASLALARQAAGAKKEEAEHAIDAVLKSGGPAARLAAGVARPFLGRPDALAGFLRVIRDGN
jgi:HEAT repeat protein